MSNGKGSTPRPLSVSSATYAENFARIKWREDTAEALRDQHLTEAREVILHAPPLTPETREKLAALWAVYDAAYPSPDPNI